MADGTVGHGQSLYIFMDIYIYNIIEYVYTISYIYIIFVYHATYLFKEQSKRKTSFEFS